MKKLIYLIKKVIIFVEVFTGFQLLNESINKLNVYKSSKVFRA